MGVTGLWDILLDVHTTASIEDLRGKTLAVDLSGWLFQSKRAGELQNKQAIKPHLRNLFGRVRLLLQHQVRLVFVLDGPAPKLKQHTLDKRHEHAKKYFPSHQDSTAHNSKAGSSADSVVCSQRGAYSSKETVECCELLDCLGVPYIASPGEAEMTCATLNMQGIVDGCITEDSDVFLYGAQTVYRNVTVMSGNSNCGAILCYKMSDIEASDVKLNREKMVAFALLAGCDYTDGVKDTGSKKAARLLQDFPPGGALQRLRDWRQSTPDLDSAEDRKTQKKNVHCSKCDHPGSVKKHRHDGCVVCHLPKSCTDRSAPQHSICQCDWHQAKQDYKDKSLEICIRRKALNDPGFPNEEIIQIFMAPSSVDRSSITWKRPHYGKLQTFFYEHLTWRKTETVEKLLPLITAWDMSTSNRNTATETSQSQPDKILGKKIHKGVHLYEVQWKSIGGVTDEERLSRPLVTREPQLHMKETYPHLVDQYEAQASQRKPAKRKGAPPDSTPSKQTHLESFFKVKKKLIFSSPTKQTDTSVLGGDPTSGGQLDVTGSSPVISQPEHSHLTEEAEHSPPLSVQE